MIRCQLLVIGAGPAGGSAALRAARAGLDVLLIERNKVIGRPLACAEALSHYGLSKFITPETSFIATEIDSINFKIANGYEYRHRFNYLVGYVLDRPKFDRRLAEMAVEVGARLKLGCNAFNIRLADGQPAEVKIEEKKGSSTIKADYVIAADGVESMIGRLAGIDTYLKLNQADTTLQYRVNNIEVDPSCLAFYVGSSYAPGGYLWVFPKSDHSANIGLGLNPARYPGKELRNYLDRFLKKAYGSYKIESVHCGNVPKFTGPKVFGRKNLLLAGDAARALDSTTGAGITKALHTGQIAARVVIRAVEKKMTHTALQKRFRRTINDEIGSELRFSRKIYPIIRKFTEDDWETLICFLQKFVEKNNTESRIDPVIMVKSAFTTAPRLIKLARHIF